MYATKLTPHVLKGFPLQVLEFLEEMSEQLSDLANRELTVLKELKVCTKLSFWVYCIFALIMLF